MSETFKVDNGRLSPTKALLRKEYRQTDVGIIPVDWSIAEFGSLVDYIKGYPFKSKDYQNDGIRIIRVSDTTFDSIKEESPIFIDINKARVYTKWSLKESDLVISTVGSKPPMYDSMVGKVIIINKKYEGYLLNQNAVLIRSRSKSNYLQYILYSHFKTEKYFNYIETIIRGNANQGSITLKELFKFKIPFPKSHEEQQSISDALRDVDVLSRSLDALIIKKRNIKQGAMQQLLTGENRLPGFAEKWQERQLANIGVFSKGKGIRKDEVLEVGLPCVRYGEIYTIHNDYIRSFASFISPLIATESRRLKKGDLLFAGSGETAEEIGKCVAYLDDQEVYAGGDIVILSPTLCDSKFLGYLMNHSTIVEQKSMFGQGNAVVHISARNLASIKLLLPDVREQSAIVAVVSDMDAEIEHLEQQRDKTKLIKQAMMQELLTGKTRLI